MDRELTQEELTLHAQVRSLHMVVLQMTRRMNDAEPNTLEVQRLARMAQRRIQILLGEEVTA